MSWKKVRLGDISNNIQTGPFGSQLHQSDYSVEGIPVVMPKDIVDGKLSDESIARVNESHVNRLKRHKIEVGDILYSRRGDVGRCALATKNEEGWLCGTGCLRVTINSDIANPKFIFYQLQKKETIGWVEKHAVGATMLNLNTSILSDVPIELPNINEQNRVVEKISAYDDLIENNKKQIKLLEEAAQRIYKEWFIDLHFPGYENVKIADGVPEGWEREKLSDIFDYVRGKSYTSKEIVNTGGVLMINLKNIKAYGGYNHNAEKRFIGKFKDEQTLNVGDIVMGITDMTQERRLVGHVAIIPDLDEKMTFSMDLIKIIPKKVTRGFLYETMLYGGLSKRLSLLANGVNVLHLKPEAMMDMKILIPNCSIMKQYDAMFEIYYRRIEELQKQCDIAREAHNRLLPKLMSGEIEV